MRLRRGTTLAGLRGMQKIRKTCDVKCGMRNEINLTTHPTSHTTHSIYRPFLSVSRNELLAYARKNNLKWVEDESNGDTQYARNKIRHQLCRIAALADRAYGKVLVECNNVFASCLYDKMAIPAQGRDDEATEPVPLTSIALDKKKFRKVLVAHERTDLSEMFRLWLAELGFRFPIGFFYDPKEPACVKIPHHSVYRRRTIAKIGPTVGIWEFRTPEEAQKFLSYEKTDKGL